MIDASAELGAPVDAFWRRIADHGLLTPAGLLGRGGWPALWAHAHRSRVVPGDDRRRPVAQ